MYIYEKSSHSLDFYLKSIVPIVEDQEDIQQVLNDQGSIWIVTNNKGKKLIDELYDSPLTIEEFKDFHITLLSSRFLNPETRSSVVRTRYLIRLDSPE